MTNLSLARSSPSLCLATQSDSLCGLIEEHLLSSVQSFLAAERLHNNI